MRDSPEIKGSNAQEDCQQPRGGRTEARGLPPLPAGFTPWMTGTRGNPDLYSAYNVRIMIAAALAAQADARREEACPSQNAIREPQATLSPTDEPQTTKGADHAE